jgi:hypothetical protein
VGHLNLTGFIQELDWFATRIKLLVA